MLSIRADAMVSLLHGAALPQTYGCYPLHAFTGTRRCGEHEERCVPTTCTYDFVSAAAATNFHTQQHAGSPTRIVPPHAWVGPVTVGTQVIMVYNQRHSGVLVSLVWCADTWDGSPISFNWWPSPKELHHGRRAFHKGL